jgi:dTMP kinase
MTHPDVTNPWKSENQESRRPPGRLVVFEGIDGAGKTTQARLLARRLTDAGLAVLFTAEPSESPAGLIIRSLKSRPDPQTEARLFTEDRIHHVQEVIQPALNEGRIVICDRYVYSSVAYQGARGIDPREILSCNRPFAVRPDVIVLLEVPVDLALSRISSGREKAATPFEVRENLEAVDRIYRSLTDPLIKRVRGIGRIEQIHDRIVQLLKEEPCFEDLRRRLD